MAFASIFVPNFSLQAVVRTEPALRERAVALIEGDPPLCSVIAANEKASQIGITIGMTKTDAEQFSGVEIYLRSLPQEAIAHAALLDIGWSISPRLEDFSHDTIVLDLSGLESLLGSESEIASHLVERSFACGLGVNIAIAANIDTALIAARGFVGITVIPPGEESRSLSSLPVRALSPSDETLKTLRRWGIATCADLTALPVLDLSERLGQEGVYLHALARGAISRSIVIAEPSHSFEEEMGLDDAVEELDPLSFVLGRLLDQLCARLNARALGAAAIRIRFELQPSFDVHASRDEIRTEKKQPGLYEKEIQLPIPARDSKMLLKLLRLRLQLNPPGAPIQKITLAADAARPRASQGGLFLPSFPDPERLELTIARIAHVVGEGNVGSPSLTDTHRPGDFEMRRFLIPQESSKTNRRPKSVRSAKKSGAHANIPMTLRIFRPAIPVKLDLESGCPTRVTFQGLHGKVVAASGPWLTSGDWWREAPRSSRHADATGDRGPWHHDEWDLEIHFFDELHPNHCHSEDRATRFSSFDPRIARKSGAVASDEESLSSFQGMTGHSVTNLSSRAESRGLSSSAFLAEAERSQGICSSLLNPVDASLSGHGFSPADKCYRFFYNSLRRGWFVLGVYD